MVTIGLLALWRRRDVLWLLVHRDLTVKYQQSVLGYLWSLIEPLAMAAIYWFIFGVLYQTEIGPGGGSYVLFLVSGLFAWMWMNTAISDSVSALTSQARLITTMKVPREVFPVARVFGRFAEYIAMLPVLLLIAVLFDGHFGLSLLALPFALALQLMLVVGLAFLLASINVLLRDVERMLRLGLRALFYAAPIIYPLDLVARSSLSDWAKTVYELNPLVGIVQLHHTVWFPTEFPTATALTASVLGSCLVFVCGRWVFRRLESAVLKEL